MKKTAYILAIATAALTFSCSGLLESETKSSFDESVVFANYTLAEYNIFSISEVFGHTNAYRGRFLPWYGFNTDAEWYNSTTGDANIQLAQYSMLPNNSNMNLDSGPYNEIYTGIERANLCINGLRKYGNTASNAQMAYLLGEALTLRALLYSDLVKAWGDAPARFEPINSKTIYLPKSSRDVIYKQILADLEESFDYLPWPATSTQTQKVDRINKAFAKGLYARIAMAAAGYALRPADGMVGTGDLGTVRLSSDPALQKSVLYPKAYKAVTDVINAQCCSLYTDYAQLWKDNNNFDLTAGKEVLFAIPFGDGRGRWNFTFAIKDADLNNRGGSVGPVPTLYFDYDPRDVRRDVSCVNFGWGKGHVATINGINSWYFGKFRFEWQIAHPYTGGNDDGVKPVVMRYSDILLMAAELANDASTTGTLSEAKGYLKQVRERAYKGNESVADAYVDAIASADGMFNAIVTERKLEFVGEFLRKGDLIRWNMLKTKMDEEKAKLTRLANLESPYNFMTGNIYYRATDGGLEIWGLDDGQTAAPSGSDWTLSSGYISPSKLKEDKINSMYSTDPDTRQFWPIFATTITNSQGSLKNDYGYE